MGNDLFLSKIESNDEILEGNAVILRHTENR